MISKHFYFNILLRILLIVILTIVLGYFIFVQKSLRISIIGVLVITILTVNLILYANTTNKKIRYFFDSVRNEDSNLSFPVEEKNQTVREIYYNMMRVNEQIQQLKIDNFNQEQFV